MKPLKRPMFRNGGPIKEGIMDGMKEPQAFNTVGNNANRDAMGREKHALFLPFLGAAGLQGLRMGAMRMAPRIANFFRTQVGTKAVPKQGPVGIGPVKVTTGPGGTVTRSSTKLTPGMGEAPIFAPNYLGRDPTVKLVGGIAKSVTSPTAKGLGGKAAQLVFSPTGIVTGAYFAGGKFFGPDGNEIPKDEVDDMGLYAGDKIDDPSTKTPTEEKTTTEKNIDTVTKDRIEENRKRYYKLMGIDKMNKDAAYDSLIDASRIIQEQGGDLKGAVKSGSLQNAIIQAVSKNLDKSADLKKQIDAAILKGEIEKDIKRNDPSAAVDLAYKKAATKRIEKDLAGGTLNEIKSEYLKQGIPLKDKTLFDEANRKGVDVKGILPGDAVEKFLSNNKTKTEADFIEKIQKDRIKAGQPILPPGQYVVGGRIVNISEGGLVDEFIF